MGNIIYLVNISDAGELHQYHTSAIYSVRIVVWNIIYLAEMYDTSLMSGRRQQQHPCRVSAMCS